MKSRHVDPFARVVSHSAYRSPRSRAGKVIASQEVFADIRASTKSGIAMPRKTGLLILGGLIVCLAAVLLYSTTREREGAVLMKIATIDGDPNTAEMVVILQESEGQRILPISVGRDQALAIHLGHKKVPSPRPLTHDLMAEILKAAHLKVDRIVITALKDGTYYAEVRLQEGKEMHALDARPSDAIALSLRVDAPIYAIPELLQDMPDLTYFENVAPHTNIAKLGIAIQPLTPSLAEFFGEEDGVLIADVNEDGPGARGGLRPGDLLVRVNDVPVKSVQSMLDLLSARASASGLHVEIARGREHRNVLITPPE